MKKYLFRVAIAILAFFIGTTFIYFTFWEKIKDSITPKSIHSIENGSPYSTIEGNKITIKSYNASFEIPKEWLEYTREKNIFLNCGELEKIKPEYGINFDEEDGQVMEAVIPFKDCAAHIGDKGWHNGFADDIQGRVYITDFTLAEVSKRIEKNGLWKSSSVFEDASVTNEESFGDWEHKKLKVLDAPTHTLWFKEICFYYRSFGNQTVVFTFVHSRKFEKEIDLILNSFKWKT